MVEFVNKKVWSRYGEAQMRAFKESVFEHYRLNGFPYYKLTREEKQHEFEKLRNFDLDSIIVGDTVRQTMHGLSLAWSYFPHSFDVRCGKAKTPLEAFNDDVMLRKAIDKRIAHGTYMTDSGMRKTLRTMTGVQAVSNFRPSAAAAIYRRYADPKNDILGERGARVWDISAGFGGRMLGAAASNVVACYDSTDPSTETHNGLRNMILDGVTFPVSSERGDVITLCSVYKVGSEEFVPVPAFYDICFTSPPYFDTEKYSEESTQSYVKFPTPDKWRDGYLRSTLRNCMLALRHGGILALNVANVKSYPTLAPDTYTVAREEGFEEVEILKLQLSRMLGTKNAGTFKHEPIFVFRKP